MNLQELINKGFKRIYSKEWIISSYIKILEIKNKNELVCEFYLIEKDIKPSFFSMKLSDYKSQINQFEVYRGELNKHDKDTN